MIIIRVNGAENGKMAIVELNEKETKRLVKLLEKSISANRAQLSHMKPGDNTYNDELVSDMNYLMNEKKHLLKKLRKALVTEE